MSVLVFVPVFNGLKSTLQCLQSVRENASSVSTAFRVLIVHDASSNNVADVAAALDQFALSASSETLSIQVRHNAINRGFTWNVNQAISALQPNEHLLLLNSDTIVTDGWLDEMMRTVNSDSKIGTVTPFSNNATICTLPDFQRAWPVPSAAQRKQIAKALAADRVEPIDIPTGVGFCMLMTRACMDKVGRYDIENFPRGYGEENDFCMRALAAGFRNVLCANAYVAHEGGVSFSESTTALKKMGGKRLLAKHPRYNELVSEWIARDPARARCEAIIAKLPRGVFDAVVAPNSTRGEPDSVSGEPVGP
jgi:O-antigen biosynthesis protein